MHPSTRHQACDTGTLEICVCGCAAEAVYTSRIPCGKGRDSQKNSTVQGMKCSSRCRYSTGAFAAMISCSCALAAMALWVSTPSLRPYNCCCCGCCCWSGGVAVRWVRCIECCSGSVIQRLPSHPLMVLVIFV
jgi:hypothetical protein